MGSARISILVAGITKCYFSCSRGVRQVNPLSPILFGIVEDFFGRWLHRMVENGELQPLTYVNGLMFSTYLLYADDVLLFCKATIRNMRALKEAFRIYGDLSGQVVNWAKSIVIFGTHLTFPRKEALVNVVSIRIGALPFSYFGVPLFYEATRFRHLLPLADKIINSF
ncbi:hypothetical protein M5689_003469 [Euphorbia peplus]|nr:hypothetical protein M5689_003469 [Euphorbia peplus]